MYKPCMKMGLGPTTPMKSGKAQDFFFIVLQFIEQNTFLCLCCYCYCNIISCLVLMQWNVRFFFTLSWLQDSSCPIYLCLCTYSTRLHCLSYMTDVLLEVRTLHPYRAPVIIPGFVLFEMLICIVSMLCCFGFFFSVTCVFNFASVSGLYIRDCPFGFL